MLTHTHKHTHSHPCTLPQLFSKHFGLYWEIGSKDFSSIAKVHAFSVVQNNFIFLLVTVHISLYVSLLLYINIYIYNIWIVIYSLQDQADSRSLSDSLDNIPSNVFGPEGIVTRFTLPLSYGRKEARQKRLG